MNGDDLRDRRQGDSAQESARRYNLVNETVRAHRGGRLGQDGQPGPINNDPCDVPVKNTSTNTISQFGILGIDTPLIDPGVSPDAYKSLGMVFNGVVPTVASHTGRFGIAQEPIAPGGIGTCRIAGASIVQVNVSSSTDTSADVTDNDATQLTSGEGSAQILLIGGGTATTGLQLCVVRLGGGGSLHRLQYVGQVLCCVSQNGLLGGDDVRCHAART